MAFCLIILLRTDWVFASVLDKTQPRFPVECDFTKPPKILAAFGLIMLTTDWVMPNQTKPNAPVLDKTKPGFPLDNGWFDFQTS